MIFSIPKSLWIHVTRCLPKTSKQEYISVDINKKSPQNIYKSILNVIDNITVYRASNYVIFLVQDALNHSNFKP